MAQLHLSAHFRRRWWYGIAHVAIALAVLFRIITDIEGAARWLIEHATVMEIKTRYAEPSARAEG